MVIDARYHHLDTLRQTLAVLLYPLQEAALSPKAALNRMQGYFVVQSRLYRENTALTKKNLEQAARLQRYRALEIENQYLRRLLGARQQYTSTAVLAEILYSRPDPFSRKILLNKGARDNISPGQPAVNDLGLVGQVVRVYPYTSEVALITDKHHATPVQILRSGVRAVAFGNGQDGNIDIPFMPANADIVPGDEVVTSGIDGTYPPGLLLGVIAKIERNSADPFLRITCKPHQGVHSYNQLLIIKGGLSP